MCFSLKRVINQLVCFYLGGFFQLNTGRGGWNKTSFIVSHLSFKMPKRLRINFDVISIFTSKCKKVKDEFGSGHNRALKDKNVNCIFLIPRPNIWPQMGVNWIYNPRRLALF